MKVPIQGGVETSTPEETPECPSRPWIREVKARDLEEILALNFAFEELLSPLNLDRLAFLHEQSAYHRIVLIEQEIAAFLLAFCEGADYDSPNYQWFSSKYEKFVYVDRIAVSPSHRGKRMGPLLYNDLFAFARARDTVHVTAEYYTIPNNEPSRRFHDSFGFQEVGCQWVADGKKKVSLQRAPSALGNEQ